VRLGCGAAGRLVLDRRTGAQACVAAGHGAASVGQGVPSALRFPARSSVELLHLNCSNRVLSHLPYMIALDHSRQAVVLAIR
jgi:hypothetical protein